MASCLSEDCSYSYSTDRTPTIQSISPSQVTPGTLVNVTGTGFSTNLSHVIVTIGNVMCDVSSVSETRITFTVGKWHFALQMIRLRDALHLFLQLSQAIKSPRKHERVSKPAPLAD